MMGVFEKEGLCGLPHAREAARQQGGDEMTGWCCSSDLMQPHGGHPGTGGAQRSKIWAPAV